MMARERRADPLVNRLSEEERQRMDMKQVFIFGLLFAPVWTCRTGACYYEHELGDRAEKRLANLHLQPDEPPPEAAADSPAECPVALYQHRQPQDLNERSLSPWRYVNKSMTDHYPLTYVEAQCLCKGCILIQGNKPPVESHDYNSVPITQTKKFYKRELCCDKNKYHLKLVNLEVTVGCTCARSKISS